MTINVEVMEDTGALVSGHGTTRLSVNNIGWKNSGLDESNSYAYYPLNRTTNTFNYSYPKYNYLKWSGTYPKASRPRIQITNTITGGAVGYTATNKVRLYYKLTNVYTPQNSIIDGSMIYLEPNSTQIIYPRISTTGPESAVDYLQWLNGNTTYFTEYLVTQVIVEPGLSNEYGNIGTVKIKFYIDEYETADL